MGSKYTLHEEGKEKENKLINRLTDKKKLKNYVVAKKIV